MGEDVELCLEVQVDPESKKILSNPDKCRSALLDVTVVKPKEVEASGTHRTNTLRAAEVRKLITSMERQRRKKQKVLDQLKDDDTIIKIRKHDDYYDSHHRSRKPYTKHKETVSSKSPVDDLERKDFIGITESVEPLFCEIRRSLKNVETRITNMQDINLELSQTTVGQSASEEYMYSRRTPRRPWTNRFRKEEAPLPSHMRNQSVYRVEAAPHDLKSVLCKNRQKLLERGEGYEGKCFCENCGIVGLLRECQKHPLAAELSESPPPSCHRQIFNYKKEPRFNVPKIDNPKVKNFEESIYIGQLSNRIKLLEERLAAQEERVVPKDYFKKIITKMVTNFSPKLFKSKSDTSLRCIDKNVKKRPISEKYSKRLPSPRDTKTHPCKSTENFCCGISNVNDHHRQQKSINTKDKAIGTDDDILYNGYGWKWGEEILKPGIDLKNRIVSLLNDILSKVALNDGGTSESSKIKEPVKHDSEAFRRFMKHMNAKVFNAQIDTKPKLLPNDYGNFETLRSRVMSGYSKRSRENSPEKLKPHYTTKEHDRYHKNIDVSYVNPKLWKTPSSNVPKDEKLGLGKNNTLGKQEFLKIVSKAKQHQKDVLWKNIWNQAKANGQTKKDVITIKIPSQEKDYKGEQKLFETDITIGEVEEILKSVLRV